MAEGGGGSVVDDEATQTQTLVVCVSVLTRTKAADALEWPLLRIAK